MGESWKIRGGRRKDGEEKGARIEVQKKEKLEGDCGKRGAQSGKRLKTGDIGEEAWGKIGGKDPS